MHHFPCKLQLICNCSITIYTHCESIQIVYMCRLQTLLQPKWRKRRMRHLPILLQFQVTSIYSKNYLNIIYVCLRYLTVVKHNCVEIQYKLFQNCVCLNNIVYVQLYIIIEALFIYDYIVVYSIEYVLSITRQIYIHVLILEYIENIQYMIPTYKNRTLLMLHITLTSYYILYVSYKPIILDLYITI